MRTFRWTDKQAARTVGDRARQPLTGGRNMTEQTETVRLLGISGSLRAASFSTAILRAVQARLTLGIELRLMTLETIPLYNEDQDRKPGLPAVAAFRSSIAACDAVLIATPEYNHGLPGVLKNALDWASRPAFESYFRAKPVLILSSATAFTGGVRAQCQLRETLASMQADVIPTREIVIPSVDRKIIDGQFQDQESLTFIAAGIDRLRQQVLRQRELALR